MEKELIDYTKLLKEESEKILKDKYINDYTRWKYERYLILANYLIKINKL